MESLDCLKNHLGTHLLIITEIDHKLLVQYRKLHGDFTITKMKIRSNDLQVHLRKMSRMHMAKNNQHQTHSTLLDTKTMGHLKIKLELYH